METKLHMKNFELLFESIKPIIYNEMKRTRINIWDREDYLQEGRIVLSLLLEEKIDEINLFRYFKTKYNQHVTDAFRMQEASKRKFNTSPYTDIHDYGELIEEKNYANVGESVSLLIDSKDYLATLSDKEFELLKKIMNGEKCDPSAKSRLKKKIKDFLRDD